MPLADLNLRIREVRLPRDVRSLLREAQRRIDRFQRDFHIPAFVPGDYEQAYRVLYSLLETDLAPGRLFCEWGSGFGVIASLAAMLGLDACGIEIEADLVEAADQLANDFGLPVEFVCGSFIPRGADAYHADNEYAWLSTDGGDAEEALGLATDDIDIIFAYPWPDEEQLTADLFEHFAAMGAILITHLPCGKFFLRQKTDARLGRT